MAILFKVLVIALAFTCHSVAQGADALQKPYATTAIEWLSKLERQRDDIQDFAELRKISCEISATLAGKYGFRETLATPAERAIMLAAITNTRKHFIDMDPPTIMSQIYFNHDQDGCWKKLSNDPGYAAHMGTVLAVDAILFETSTRPDFITTLNKQRQAFGVSDDFIEIFKTVATSFHPANGPTNVQAVLKNAISMVSPKAWQTIVNETSVLQMAVLGIPKILQNGIPTIDESTKKEIVLFLGNPNSGKSTLIQLLTEGMQGDECGMLLESPQLNNDGTVENCLCTASSRELLLTARSTKIIWVTSASELEAARGELCKTLRNTFAIFERQFVESSCLLAINMVDGNRIDGRLKLYLQELGLSPAMCANAVPIRTHGADEIEALFTEPRSSNIGSLVGERSNLSKTLLEDSNRLQQAVMATKGRAVRKVNMSLEHSPETAEVLVEFFVSLARKTLRENTQAIYTQTLTACSVNSTNIYATQDSCWQAVRNLFESNRYYKLLQPLAADQEAIAAAKFKDIFGRACAVYTPVSKILVS
jgi:energy-coupling factor transporter ATP-binding protein EcfA2